MLHPQVSGDKNEEQVLNAIEAYTEHRPEITSRAINLLFDIARIERCNQLLRALKLVIAALKCHKYDKNIQVTGSAALFYLTNSEYRSEQSVRLRRQVIQVVLNGMESYQEVTVSPLPAMALHALAQPPFSCHPCPSLGKRPVGPSGSHACSHPLSSGTECPAQLPLSIALLPDSGAR